MPRKSKYQKLTVEHPLNNQTAEPAYLSISKAQFDYLMEMQWDMDRDLKVRRMYDTQAEQSDLDVIEGERHAFFHGIMDRLIEQTKAAR